MYVTHVRGYIALALNLHFNEINYRKELCKKNERDILR